MTGPTSDENAMKLWEARVRADTMESVTELLNIFMQFMKAESESSLEEDLRDMMDTIVREMVAQGEEGLVGHVLLALCALVCECADHEAVQEFMNHQAEMIQRMYDEVDSE